MQKENNQCVVPQGFCGINMTLVKKAKIKVIKMDNIALIWHCKSEALRYS